MNLATNFSDMPDDDLDAAPSSAASAAAPVYTQACPRCSGRGRVAWGVCFKCNGAGKLEFKTSPHERLKNRQAAQRSAERKSANAWDAFKGAQEAAASWIEAKQESFGFAKSMREAVEKFGHLTYGQLQAVYKCIAADADRELAREQARTAAQAVAAAAPVVTVQKIEESFQKAKSAGIRVPKLRLDTFLFKPAPASGKNAGAIYVMEEGAYLGKVMGGRFLKTRECSDEAETRIVAAAADPAAAAIAYGQRFGACSVCGRDLTNKESIDLGIGPICKARFGF